jgi:hypothetical protein
MVGIAHAGKQRCVAGEQSVSAMVNGMTLAAQTRQALDKANVKVGIIARAGQDLSKYKQYYSHIGFVYRDTKDPNKPVWRVVHKLNHCGSSRADLFRQGLIEFFTDDPFELATTIVPFKPGVAQQVINAITNPERLSLMHEPSYSLVANPWSVKYQQSNQWVTETLAMSVNRQIERRVQAQQWLSFSGYEPDSLKISTFAQFGAELTKGNVRFDDHPRRDRVRQRIRTTTADSVLRWTDRVGLTGNPIVVKLAHPMLPTAQASPKRAAQATQPALH